MNERLDAQIGRVQLVSRWMHWLFKIASGLIAMVFLSLWISMMLGGDPWTGWIVSLGGISIHTNALSPIQLALVGIVTAVMGYYGCRIPWHIAGLFRCFEEQQIYTSSSIREIHSIGRSLFFLGVFQIVSTFVAVWLVPSGSVKVDLTTLIGGAFVMLLAWIFETGRKMQIAEVQGA